jgi:hypothetical protein
MQIMATRRLSPAFIVVLPRRVGTTLSPMHAWRSTGMPHGDEQLRATGAHAG